MRNIKEGVAVDNYVKQGHNLVDNSTPYLPSSVHCFSHTSHWIRCFARSPDSRFCWKNQTQVPRKPSVGRVSVFWMAGDMDHCKNEFIFLSWLSQNLFLANIGKTSFRNITKHWNLHRFYRICKCYPFVMHEYKHAQIGNVLAVTMYSATKH